MIKENRVDKIRARAWESAAVQTSLQSAERYEVKFVSESVFLTKSRKRVCNSVRTQQCANAVAFFCSKLSSLIDTACESETIPILSKIRNFVYWKETSSIKKKIFSLEPSMNTLSQVYSDNNLNLYIIEIEIYMK